MKALRNHRITAALACLVLALSAASAQEANMARLALSDSVYTRVVVGLHGADGDARAKDLFTPEARVQGSLDATSRQKVGESFLYGRFGYAYEYGWRSTWRGWMDPGGTPFMLADSIPGNLSLERYSLQAGLARPLGDGWSAGLDLAYDVALMAKHKDLRNKNTGMTFRVAPGVHWQGASLSAGLDAGYERSTEKVEYSQESSSVEHVLYSVYGLWVAQGYGYASAETKRLKENDRFFGDLQLGLKAGKVRIRNDFGLSRDSEQQSETGYNNLRHGVVHSLRWRDELRLDIGSRHTVEAGVEWTTMQGFKPLQRQELDPDSKVRVWVDVCDPVFCYYRRFDREWVGYSFGDSWKLSAGVENLRLMQAYTEHPQRFTQRVSVLAPHVGARVPIGAAWRVTADLTWSYCYEAACDVSAWQLAAPLSRQYDFWTSGRLCGRVHLSWTQGRMTLGLDYGCLATTAFPGFRHETSLTLGLAL